MLLPAPIYDWPLVRRTSEPIELLIRSVLSARKRFPLRSLLRTKFRAVEVKETAGMGVVVETEVVEVVMMVVGKRSNKKLKTLWRITDYLPKSFFFN